MMVSEIGEGVTELAGHLVEVDLQDNLFGSWEKILQLASKLPNLNNLLLHGNKLGDISLETNALAR
jgi:Ran GTPase-activating protein (RanGAP) involved in mRNA processing and transport